MSIFLAFAGETNFLDIFRFKILCNGFDHILGKREEHIQGNKEYKRKSDR